MNWKLAAGAILVGVLLGSGASARSSAQDTPLSDPAQELFISNLHEFARPTMRAFIRAVEATGWKVIIASGYRDFWKQLQLWNENHQNAEPGESYHNYGMAIDINVKKNGVQVRKADSNETWYSTGVPQIAQALGLQWGGGGNFGSYHDPVHFDMSKLLKQKYGQHYNTVLLKQKAFAQFGTTWEDIQGNKLILA